MSTGLAKRNITLPHNWSPRPDQMGIWNYLERGGKRLDVVAHRRFGKDDISLHWAATAAHQKVGTYWHMLPQAAQARKAIWDAVNPRTGKRRIDEAFPKELRAATREQEMMIVFKNGSTWQVLGSDNYDSYVGSPPIGVVFSEWSLAKPAAWAYVRPILLENGGTAIFIWTPRGRNHATRAFEARERDPSWYTARIPTCHIDATDYSKAQRSLLDPNMTMCTAVFTREQMLQELRELVEEAGSPTEGLAKFCSEYLVDFDSAVPGAYYATELQAAHTAGRVGDFPYDPKILVDTAWDLGIDDYTAIWFFQRFANKVRFIDYYEVSDVGLDTIVKEGLNNPRSMHYKYGMHYLPHDVMVREIGAGGQTRKATLHKLGLGTIRVGVARDPEERISAVRRLIPFMEFNADTTQTGLDHVKQYRKRWNQSLGVFVGPLHDEHSHAADAMGEAAINAKIRAMPVEEKDDRPPSRWEQIFNKARNPQPSWKVV